MNQLIDLASQLHPEALKILLVLGLSFLLGLEREGRKAHAGHYIFGGVRTFPMIGLLGYSVALISGPQILPVAVGLLAVAAFLLVSYRHKLQECEDAGVTTEFTGMVTYVLGALVFYGHYWIATTVVVLAMLLLELKVGLESLTERIPTEDVVTFTKFLLLTAVILPAVPKEDIGPFHLNPFRTWLVVVAVCGISYGSYVLQKVTKKHGGIVLAAILGGAYSSTVMTVVLARRAKRENRPHLFSGAILMASGMMFLRLVVLLLIFSRELLAILLWPFLSMAAVALLGGLLWTRLPDGGETTPEREYEAKNPLEMKAAFTFAAIFVALVVITSLVLRYFGQLGMYALAVVMGAVDVDPFIMGLTQSAGAATPVQAAAAAILVTTASNNLMKGIYALSFADRPTGRRSLAGLLLIALAGLGWIALVL
jgi:uncharacterized membrane protein (DUF4010 family)